MPTDHEVVRESGKTVKRKWLRRIVFGILAMCAGALMGAFAVYRALQWVPQFYEQELDSSDTNLLAGGRQMEQRVLELQDDLQEGGDEQDETQWEATFSDDEINGWLAVDLKKEFPRLLPSRVHDPRISISEHVAQIACQYKSPDLTVVLSMDVDPFLTDKPNVIGFRVRRARIGAVPGLEKMAKDRITQAAQRSHIELHWTEQDGDQVALVTIPFDAMLKGHQLWIEKIELHDGAVCLAGRSQRVATDEFATLQVTARQEKGPLNKKRQL